jgi:hypothetical protein
MKIILDPKILEDFCHDFINRLSKYQLSYYLRDKYSGYSKENAIHASIIWTREAVCQINNSKTIAGSKELSDLLVLISFIDILLEARDQIYCTMYKEDRYPEVNEVFCFQDAPSLYKELKNRNYFKEIRALFSAHPLNIREPTKKPQAKRFADVPFIGNTAIARLANQKGDFYTRLWTATIKDEDTIYFPLYVDDLVAYAHLVYSCFYMFQKRLKQIANKHT